MSRLRRVIIPLLIIVVLLVVVQTVMKSKSTSNGAKPSYQGGSQSFVSQLNAGQVSSRGRQHDRPDGPGHAHPGNGAAYTIIYPDATLLAQLLAKHPGRLGLGQERQLVVDRTAHVR